MSSTQTRTATFNRSNARYVATKVAADLHRMQHLYGWPNDTVIAELVEEITEMLALDYLKTVEVGFERQGRRVVSLKYESRRDGTLSGDDNAGGLPRGADVSSCTRINYMTYTAKFSALSSSEQLAVKQTLPYVRSGAPEPTDGDGYWVEDRTYSSNGGGTVRRTFKPYS